MAKYTTTVRRVCESLAGFKVPTDANNWMEAATTAAPKIFRIPQFPIFDETYRQALEIKILMHYWDYEIGLETFGSWKAALCQKMCEIMPYYNQLYTAAALEFDPFFDVDLSTQHNKTQDITKDNESSGKSTSVVTGKQSTTGEDTGSDRTTDNVVTSGTDNLAKSNTRDITESTTDKTEFAHGESNTHTITESGSREGTDNTVHSGNDTKWDYFHDTPQGSLSGITTENYLTNARKNTNDYSSSDNRSFDETTSANNKDELDAATHGTDDYTHSATNQVTDTGSDNRTVDMQVASNGNVNTTFNTSRETENTQSTTNEDSREGNETVKDVMSYLTTVKGRSGGKSNSELFMEYLKTFMNIDMMVIEELHDLFMLLW